jgi:hypothetical protein
VNYYDLFVRTLSARDPAPDGPGNISSFHPGLAELAMREIPFARFAACGYWPVEMQLYLTNRTEYLRRFDLVVRSAEEYQIGLIPSFFWLHSTVPDLVGEPVSAWGRTDSRTRGFLERYTTDLVRRYRASPAIWAWEFGNEFNLPADLPNAADHRPPIVPRLGTPATRSAADDLTHAAMRSALGAFAEIVRREDPRRLILSGHAFPRATAWHQMTERSWGKDSPGQFATMLVGDNPAPVNSFTVRGYETSDWDRLAAAADIARRERRPLFVGEFGIKGRANDEQRREFQQQLERLHALGVPLAALWVYDFKGQDTDWNVNATHDRAYQLDALAEANRRLRGESALPAKAPR